MIKRNDGGFAVFNNIIMLHACVAVIWTSRIITLLLFAIYTWVYIYTYISYIVYTCFYNKPNPEIRTNEIQ